MTRVLRILWPYYFSEKIWKSSYTMPLSILQNYGLGGKNFDFLLAFRVVTTFIKFYHLEILLRFLKIEKNIINLDPNGSEIFNNYILSSISSFSTFWFSIKN